jgi:ribonuclease H2 subunit A
MEETQIGEEGTPNLALETPTPGVFVPPSIHREVLLSGDSYMHFSPVPPSLLPDPAVSTTSPSKASDDATATKPVTTLGPPCCLGVDEAGRGPVLGPMVYGVFYLPVAIADDLLKTTHHFDDSKVLTPATRSALMAALCTAGSDLHDACGWAVSSLGARAIGAGMFAPAGAAYNLNAQALDATIALIRGVLDRGVHVREVYVDTVGPPATHQARLQRAFPGLQITVAKKADSLYPCVSAASVAAKVTRDAALEVLFEARVAADEARLGSAADELEEGGAEEAQEDHDEVVDKKRKATGKDSGAAASKKKKAGKKDDDREEMAWGSGYPSDARCVGWLRRNMHPVFGWGPECRFSWGTVKDMLEGNGGVKVDWPLSDDEEGTSRLTDFFVEGGADKDAAGDELGSWFGTPAGLEAF